MQRHDEKHLITQRLQMPLPELARLLQQVGHYIGLTGNQHLRSQVYQAELPCSVLGLVYNMCRHMLRVAII